jgi:hypothetical protein
MAFCGVRKVGQWPAKMCREGRAELTGVRLAGVGIYDLFDRSMDPRDDSSSSVVVDGCI